MILETRNLQLNFKLKNKLAFIRDDNIKDEFIQMIKERQFHIDQQEKENFRNKLKELVDFLITKRR